MRVFVHDGLTTAERQELTPLRREDRQLKAVTRTTTRCANRPPARSKQSLYCANTLRPMNRPAPHILVP